MSEVFEKLSPQERVTRAIVAAIEAGAPPWVCPWDRTGAQPPAMALPLRSSGEAYSGVNVLTLWCAAQAAGHTSRYWFTFKQAQALGAYVRKGEKSQPVVYYGQTLDKKHAETKQEGEEDRTFRFLKAYPVFNACQIEGLPAEYMNAAPAVAPKPRSWEDVAHLDAWVIRTGVTVKEFGVKAEYSPGLDRVHMPERHRFKTPEDFYATTFHELTHATGAGHRVGRQFGKRFGDHAYAVEELVAELGAAFLCAHHGLWKPERTDHASYLASWLKVLKADNRAIFKAAAEAQKATDWLKKRAGDAIELQEAA